MRAALAVLVLTIGFASEASAQSFSFRGGVDVRPLIGNSSAGFHTIADGGWLGIDIAPGLSLLDLLTLELDLVPMIPITKSDTFDPQFEFMVIPGARLDLSFVYVRAGVPIVIGDGVQPAIEGGLGISLLSFAYLGVLVDYYFDFQLFSAGLEAGVSF